MDYTNMSAYYDVIMTSGYYDYQGIVDGLMNHQPVSTILEIGCGTGLILEEFAKRQPHVAITGVDLTQAMLDIAKPRLQAYPQVKLSQENVVEFDLKQQLKQKKPDSALFNTPQFVRRLENIYQVMVERAASGQSPQNIEIV